MKCALGCNFSQRWLHVAGNKFETQPDTRRKNSEIPNNTFVSTNSRKHTSSWICISLTFLISSLILFFDVVFALGRFPWLTDYHSSPRICVCVCVCEWLVDMCCISHSYVRHDLFMCSGHDLWCCFNSEISCLFWTKQQRMIFLVTYARISSNDALERSEICAHM